MSTSDEATKRQEEVSALIFKGCTYEEIGSALGIALDTVKWHAKKLLKFHGCRTRSQLMAEEIERLQERIEELERKAA